MGQLSEIPHRCTTLWQIVATPYLVENPALRLEPTACMWIAEPHAFFLVPVLTGWSSHTARLSGV